MVIERHRVIAGVIWLNQAPVETVETVRCAADPEAIWITLRPGRDYRIVDAEHGQLYVSALVGTLVEVVYTVGPGTARPRDTRAWGRCERPQVAHHSRTGGANRGTFQYPYVPARCAP